MGFVVSLPVIPTTYNLDVGTYFATNSSYMEYIRWKNIAKQKIGNCQYSKSSLTKPTDLLFLRLGNWTNYVLEYGSFKIL